ncbi:MAG: hypothetical protein GXO61_02555 [Epsilonproteobacteria bacterium]|nr:hypothetical protein [Campylobacterota bacterium]
MRVLGVLVAGFSVLAFGAIAPESYIKDLKAYLTSRCFTLNGALYRYDFDKDGVLEYNDWVYESIVTGQTYRLLGEVPTKNNPFGFKIVEVDTSNLTPLGYFSFIDFPKDEDRRFSWIYLFGDSKVAKLMGTNSTNFFDYLFIDGRPYFPDLGYQLEEDSVSIIYKEQNFPNIIAGYDTPGFSWSVKLLSNKLLLADSTKGVAVVDISSLTYPRFIGEIPTYNALDVTSTEKFAYVADESQGVSKIDLESLSKVESETLEGEIATTLALLPQRAVYVGTPANKLFVVDISNGKLRKDCFLTLDGQINEIVIKWDKMYVADNVGGVTIYSLQEPLSPKEIGFYSLEGAKSVAVGNDILYISLEDSSKVVTLDITNNSRYEFENDEKVRKLVLSPDKKKLYLLNEVSSISVYDLTIPSHPKAIGKIYIPYPAYDMEISTDGRYGFIAEGGDGLKILDLTK